MGVRGYPASDEAFAWLKSLSGMLTKINTKYGSFSQLVEHSEWDEGKTDLVLRLIKSLREHLEKVEKELADHVNGKFG